MIRLTKKPQKKVYTDLINLAFDTCDRFHLVIRKDMGPLDMFKDFLKQLDSSLIEVKEESEWASNILADGEKAFVYYYHTDSSAKAIILDATNSLYDWVYPQLPEDLSFFKNGKEWLATNSHEQECYILTEDKNEIDKVMNIKGIKASLEE
ncbi:stage III sporulation protein AH [Peribacillus simplex]|uniref:stage III sporulation protein AH n=1 Tax=Peribacillus TaxID=2675229 RepID=UPI00315C5DFA